MMMVTIFLAIFSLLFSTKSKVSFDKMLFSVIGTPACVLFWWVSLAIWIKVPAYVSWIRKLTSAVLGDKKNLVMVRPWRCWVPSSLWTTSWRTTSGFWATCWGTPTLPQGLLLIWTIQRWEPKKTFFKSRPSNSLSSKPFTPVCYCETEHSNSQLHTIR